MITRVTLAAEAGEGLHDDKPVDHPLHEPRGMRFNVTVVDPPGERFEHFMFDMARYVMHSIESLGYDCTLERNRCDPRAVNVIVGAHLLAARSEADALLSSARDYVVLETEHLAGGKLNDHDVGNRLTDVTFPLLRGARAVWECMQLNLPVLAKQGIEADLFQFGYHPKMEEVSHKLNKDIDFLFYGSISPWRRTVLGNLEALGYRVRVEFDAMSVFRNDLIARSEVILTLRHGHGQAMGHLPHARIVYAVTNRCLVVGEGGLEQESLEDVFVWTNNPAELVNLCRATRGRGDRRALARSLHEKLRSRPMTSFMAPLIAHLEGGSREPAARLLATG